MANRCYLYGKEEESCDHILIHRDMTSAILGPPFYSENSAS